MVSSAMLSAIHQRLCDIYDNSQFFGDIGLILVGDIFQLKPCRGKFPFENELLARQFELYFLDTNVGQSNDPTYAELLARARVGTLLEEDVALLKTRLVDTNMPPFVNTLHIFPKVSMVQEFNTIQQNNSGEEVHVIEAHHEYTNIGDSDTTIVADELIPNDDRDAGGLPSFLRVHAF